MRIVPALKHVEIVYITVTGGLHCIVFIVINIELLKYNTVSFLTGLTEQSSIHLTNHL